MKRIACIISILFLTFIAFEFYLYQHYKNSGFIVLQNETGLVNQDLDISILVNGKLVMDTIISSNDPVSYFLNTKHKFGDNLIEVNSVKLGITQTKSVHVFPVNFLVISILENQFEIDKYYSPPLLQ